MSFPAPRLHRAPVAILALLGTLACAAEVDGPPPADPTPPGERPTPPDDATVTVLTSTAAPGTSVPIEASGFAPNTAVEIGFGQPRSEYSVVTETRTDAAGRVEASVQVPDWATRGEPYVIVVTEPDHDPRATSEPFVVGAPGDRVRIHGELTDEGVECPAVRGPFGTLYTLAVSGQDHEPGTQVMVEGTIAEMSICMQGTTIDVESIEAH